MTQDRRKDDKLPEGPLVFTDRNLTAAGLAHLEAERAAACLVHAGGEVWVGVGTKDALRGLLSEDTASQSQAVPSELASLDRFQPLFSRSAATGKVASVPSAVPEPSRASRIECALRLIIEADDGQALTQDLIEAGRSALALASPAAPLAAAVPAEEASDVQISTWRTIRGHVLTDALNGSDITLPARYANDVLALFDVALPRVPDEDNEDGWAIADPAGVVDRLRKATQVLLDSAIQHVSYNEDSALSKATSEADEALAACVGYVPFQVPAEPAPIQASALTDERIKEVALDASKRWASLKEVSGLSTIAFARAIEREVTARLSTPTAPVAADAMVTAPSIDTPDFGHLLGQLIEVVLGTEKEVRYETARAALTAHIDARLRQAQPVSRDAVLEEAAVLCESDDQEYEIGRRCAVAIRALKSQAAATAASKEGA